MREVLSTLKQKMRIGCFERTGCLIKLHPGDSDKLVKPQGLKLPFTIPGGDHVGDVAMPRPPEEVMPNNSIEETWKTALRMLQWVRMKETSARRAKKMRRGGD